MTSFDKTAAFQMFSKNIRGYKIVAYGSKKNKKTKTDPVKIL